MDGALDDIIWPRILNVLMIYTCQKFLEYGESNVHRIRKSSASATMDPGTGGTD